MKRRRQTYSCFSTSVTNCCAEY